MQTSQNGLSIIREFEGFSAKAYVCPAGKWTIGYGHVIGWDESGLKTISKKQAEQLLIADIKPIESTLLKLVKTPISQNQFDALVSLIYNIGMGAFTKSRLLRRLNAGDANAAEEFDRWIYIGKKASTGLKNRRAREKELYSHSK